MVDRTPKPGGRLIVNPSLGEVTTLLKNETSPLGENLRIIDSELIIPDVGEIDLVGLSPEHLVLISVHTEITEEHLRKATSINQWVFENLSVLKHVYSPHGLTNNFLPKIILLGCRIQPAALPLIPFLADLPLAVHRYRLFTSGQQRWLEISQPPEVVSKKSSFLDKFGARNSVELTHEELGAFFDAAADDVAQKEEPVHQPAPEIDFEGPYFN